MRLIQVSSSTRLSSHRSTSSTSSSKQQQQQQNTTTVSKIRWFIIFFFFVGIINIFHFLKMTTTTGFIGGDQVVPYELVNDCPQVQQQAHQQQHQQAAGATTTTTTRRKSSSSLSFYVCEELQRQVRDKKTLLLDPNDGFLFARQQLRPLGVSNNIPFSFHPFMVSVHKESIDPLRYNTIYQRGRYYEYEVMQRFVKVLSSTSTSTSTPNEQQQQQQQQPINDNNIIIGGKKKRMRRRKKKKQIILDVGANIGYYTLLSLALTTTSQNQQQQQQNQNNNNNNNIDLISFEVNPLNLLRLCESLQINSNYNSHYHEDGNDNNVNNNVNNNNWMDRVYIYQKGVYNEDSVTLPIHIPIGNPGQARVNLNKRNTPTDNSTIHVQSITLDTFAQQQGWFNNNNLGGGDENENDDDDDNISIIILKMDVEGVEPFIIDGAQKLLQSGMVVNIFMEYRRLGRPIAQRSIQILLDCNYVLVVDDNDNNNNNNGVDQQHIQQQQQQLMTKEETIQHLNKLKLELGSKTVDLWFQRTIQENQPT